MNICVIFSLFSYFLGKIDESIHTENVSRVIDDGVMGTSKNSRKRASPVGSSLGKAEKFWELCS